MTTLPVPFALTFRLTFVSLLLTPTVGPPTPVTAFVIETSETADATGLKVNISLPLLSLSDVMTRGVVSDGLVPNTSGPLPVSSLITPANCADVVEEKKERLFPFAARAPEVGRVTLVGPVEVNVIGFAPEVVRLPARFSVRLPSLSVKVSVLPAVRFSVLLKVR